MIGKKGSRQQWLTPCCCGGGRMWLTTDQVVAINEDGILRSTYWHCGRWGRTRHHSLPYGICLDNMGSNALELPPPGRCQWCRWPPLVEVVSSGAPSGVGTNRCLGCICRCCCQWCLTSRATTTMLVTAPIGSIAPMGRLSKGWWPIGGVDEVCYGGLGQLVLNGEDEQ